MDDLLRKNLLMKNALDEIKSDIQNLSPYPEKVKLVVVSKYSSTEEVMEAYNLGVRIFGENKVQSLMEKKEYFQEKKIYDISWDFIGNLQSNKVKYIYDFVRMIHSVNKLSLAEEINKRATALSRRVDVLLEINVLGEESKEGYLLENLKKDLEKLTKLENINIIGLMTMAPFTENEKILRQVFAGLRKIKEIFNREIFNNKLVELSMGMTNDYKIALEEGATIIRIGSKIFK
ncbi:YggS family pyridoxal phosphate-dependent enzyme [Fusobacterium sp. PH5-44]|uniref:YggS family pyridoxal phosphate-dependent enzyme n=1 Tax=unclassified Fusobacterium TaxID=2648384 RepID=UPI003D1E8607